VGITSAAKVIRETNFSGISPAARGKVRDIYDLGDRLLLVATDRLSAFDVIMPTPIPDRAAYSPSFLSSGLACFTTSSPITS